MKKTHIAFDVDGTLRCNKKPYPDYPAHEPVVINERRRTLLVTLASFKNVVCHIWSAQGEDYAKHIRKEMGLEKYVKESNCHAKNLDHTTAGDFTPDIAIDDMHKCELGHFNLIVNEK